VTSSLGGPAVWRGAELARRADWCTELASAHVAELLAATARVADRPLVDIDRDAFPLPTFAAVLDAVLDDVVSGRGFALLRGVPVDGLDEAALERLYWSLGTHLGIGIRQNDAGDLLVHVKDQGLDFANPEVRGYQTAQRLEYHSDSSDVVGLLCVHPALEGGVSTIVSAGAVFEEAIRLRPDLAAVLSAPWWWDKRKPDLTESFFERPIFAVHDGAVVSYYGRAHIESAVRGPQVPELTAGQIAALDLLDEIANDPAFVLPMDFRPGDVQLLNNYRIWHARTAYVDDPDRPRDLFRLWLTLRQDIALPTAFQTGGITDRTAAYS
jgi:Taurine catabolism dioxygenase TauD, TfdA family